MGQQHGKLLSCRHVSYNHRAELHRGYHLEQLAQSLSLHGSHADALTIHLPRCAHTDIREVSPLNEETGMHAFHACCAENYVDICNACPRNMLFAMPSKYVSREAKVT